MMSPRFLTTALGVATVGTLVWAVATCQRPADGTDASPPAAAAARGAVDLARRKALAAKKPISQDGELQVDAADRCPVCAMRVEEHPKFACGIQLKDGTTFYFCATGCLLRSWLHPEIFISARRDDISRLVVKDYFSGRAVDASEVFWVAGSDVQGPMGPALVPIEGEEALEAFKRRHGYRSTFRLDALDDTRWQELTGRAAAPNR